MRASWAAANLARLVGEGTLTRSLPTRPCGPAVPVTLQYLQVFANQQSCPGHLEVPSVSFPLLAMLMVWCPDLIRAKLWSRQIYDLRVR